MASLAITNESVLRPIRVAHSRLSCAPAWPVLVAVLVATCQTATAQDSSIDSFNAAVRITQLGSQLPTVGQPTDSGGRIESILPSRQNVADNQGQHLATPRRVEVQGNIRKHLDFQGETPEGKKQRERFIPRIVDPQHELALKVGHPRILTFAEWATKPDVRLYVADEKVIRWDIISDTEVAIVGAEPGTTVLTLWFNDPTTETGKRVLSFHVEVVSPPAPDQPTIKQLENQINETFPDSLVRLSMVGKQLVVRGQAKDTVEAQQIIQVVELHAPKNQAGYTIRTARTSLGPRGVVSEEEEEDPSLGQELNAGQGNNPNVINLLTVSGEQQVMLRVTVAEINRSALRSIGADMQIGSGEVNFLSLVANTNPMFGQQNMAGGVNNALRPVSGQGNLIVNAPDFRLALNALRQVNLARTLAEPNLVALNGRSATFFAGDRVPLPNATANAGGVGQGVRFDNVGVTLTFTPHIVDRNRVRLELAGSVSTLDSEQTNIGGSGVSTQNARTFQTTVDLRDGDTMAMAGLILNTMRSNASRVPLVGDLPGIGTLFSNKSNTYTEQELVILVTPELAHPLPACETPPLPGSDVFEPTDVEFYLGNRLESRRSRDFRSSVRTDYGRLVAGQRCDCNPFIIGPSGHSYGCCDHPQTIPQSYPLGQVESLPLPAASDPRE